VDLCCGAVVAPGRCWLVVVQSGLYRIMIEGRWLLMMLSLLSSKPRSGTGFLGLCTDSRNSIAEETDEDAQG
jgi:hypothetical protein